MKKVILVLAASLALTACMKEQGSVLPPNNAVKEANTAEKSVVTRPMFVNFYATPNLTLPPVQCLPAAANIYVSRGMIIHGTATHLGLVDPENSFGTVQQCNLGPLPYQLSIQSTGQVAAANGDLLYYGSAYVISLSDGTFTGVVTITGGTGRFLNATGSINIQGTVDFQTGFVQWTGAGTITY